MSADICVVGGCGNKVKVKRLGMCEKHYMRHRRTGSAEFQYSFSDCEVCSKPIRYRYRAAKKRFCSDRCMNKAYAQTFKVQVSCLGCKQQRTMANYNSGSGQCNKCAALKAAKLAGATNKLLAAVKYWEPPKPRICTKGYLSHDSNLKAVASICKDDSCKRLFVGRTRHQVYCSPKCSRRSHKRMFGGSGTVRKRLTRYKTPINSYTYQTGINALTVAERYGWRCVECGIAVERHKGRCYHGNGATVGHIVPLSKGGFHTWDNVQCECADCNSIKGANHECIDDAIMAMAHADKKAKGVNGLRGASAN